MLYKVCNLERDMKLGAKLIKRGESVSVSQQEYQFLAQVYGMAVKGEKEYTVRITEPTQIIPTKVEIRESVKKEPEPILVKKRKNKKR